MARTHLALCLLLAAPALLGVACANPPDVIHVPFSIPVQVAGGLSGGGGGSLPGAGSELSREIGDQGVDESDVDSVTVSELTLTHDSPSCELLAGCDLSFIESLVLSASASGQPTVELGRLTRPGAVKRADLQPAEVELKAYLGGGDLAFTATLVPATTPLQTVEMTLDAVLRVDIDLF
ncbi:MAG: hypothetical protein P1V51_18680 [Deltaproteobacteria bacterium]|nr:hypothetical protein [Deltaproteobacteria bacterium]